MVVRTAEHNSFSYLRYYLLLPSTAEHNQVLFNDSSSSNSIPLPTPRDYTILQVGSIHTSHQTSGICLEF